MRYYMQYLKTANVNLVKDMGMIPYKLHQLYQYDCTVSTYKLGEYSYLDSEVKGLKIDFIKNFFHNLSLDGSYFLKKKAKEIDVLQIFHMTLSSVFYAFTYKYFNPKGILYLKLDCSHKLITKLHHLSLIQYTLLDKFLNQIDLISVEQEELYHTLQKMLVHHKRKLIHIPNGIDFEDLKRKGICYEYAQKENIILNVARIGAEEKNSPMLLEAFAKIKNIENINWKLILVGPIEESFTSYIEEYFKRNPALKNKVVFKGNLEDRQALFAEYAKAKIFSLTSEFESFGIVFTEAAALGDVILSTDVGIASELVSQNNGKLVPCKAVDQLAEVFTEYINKSDEEFKKCCDTTYELCKTNFDWNKIIEVLHKNLIQCSSK